MKRQLLIVLLVVAFAAVPLLAGPTFGFGFGFYPDTLYFAPNAGMQWNSEPVGLETNLSLTLVSVEAGTFDDIEYALAGFWEIINVTMPFMNGEDGGVVGLLIGIGTPFILEGDGNDFEIAGMSLGLQGGIYVENDRGTGFTLLGWWNGDGVGIGARFSGDLFPAKPQPKDEV